MEISNLRDLLKHELQDLHNAEQQLVKALPEMAERANSDTLKSALKSHLEETKGQVLRLEEAANILGVQLGGKACKAMQGLIEEGRSLLSEAGKGDACDAAIILACQKVEHYEIASYGSVAAFAEELGETEIVDLLEETLQEESAANEKLNDIAMEESNVEAAQEDMPRAGNE